MSQSIASQLGTTVRTLVTSKRSMVVLITAVVDAYVILFAGEAIPPEKVMAVAQIVTVLGGLLVSGISVSDHGKAMGKPAGEGHKPSA